MSNKPCPCWTKTWHAHDGHCCFDHDAPEDCHETQASQSGPRDVESVLAGRYWLTEKGWAAVGGRSA